MRFFSAAISPIRYLADSVLPLLFWVLLIFGFDTPDVAVLTIIAAIIHEGGHMLALGATKRSARLRSHLSGFRIRARGASYAEELIALAAGPLANLAVFLVTLPFFGSGDGYAELVGYLNLLSALSNLMPIEGYDGFGILRTLASIGEWRGAERALYGISFVITLLFTLFSLYLMLRYGGGYWIFGVFFITMIAKIKKLLPRESTPLHRR